VALASTDGYWPIRRVVEAGAFCILGLEPSSTFLRCSPLGLRSAQVRETKRGPGFQQGGAGAFALSSARSQLQRRNQPHRDGPAVATRLQHPNTIFGPPHYRRSQRYRPPQPQPLRTLWLRSRACEWDPASLLAGSTTSRRCESIMLYER
jgi:hypothetical protein